MLFSSCGEVFLQRFSSTPTNSDAHVDRNAQTQSDRRRVADD